MKFTDNMIIASQDAREQVLGFLEEAKRKTFLQDVLGEIKFIGDEIPRTELERVLEISKDTSNRFIKANKAELEEHGYRVVRGSENLKALVEGMKIDAHTFFGRTTVVGLFTIDAALSFAMVLTESEPAKRLRTALIELTKLSSPEQLYESAARAWEKDDFKAVWAMLSRAPGFKRHHGIQLQKQMFRAVFGMEASELKQVRQQIRPGKETTARNFMTDDELMLFSSVERLVLTAWQRFRPISSTEMYEIGKKTVMEYLAITSLSK